MFACSDLVRCVPTLLAVHLVSLLLIALENLGTHWRRHSHALALVLALMQQMYRLASANSDNYVQDSSFLRRCYKAFREYCVLAPLAVQLFHLQVEKVRPRIPSAPQTERGKSSRYVPTVSARPTAPTLVSQARLYTSMPAWDQPCSLGSPSALRSIC